MSRYLSVTGYADKTNPEFVKHYNAVVFCVENDLSFPIETTEFFEGKIDGEGLDAYLKPSLPKLLENGIGVPITQKFINGELHIDMKDIPKEVVKLIITND